MIDGERGRCRDGNTCLVCGGGDRQKRCSNWPVQYTQRNVVWFKKKGAGAVNCLF